MDSLCKACIFFLLFICDSVYQCDAAAYRETNSQICITEDLAAKCPYSQTILITKALYGHIAISKCIGMDFGQFGCYSNVQDIVSKRCDGRNRCEISTPDPEIVATKTCVAGLAMYMDVSYVCIPDTLKSVGCDGVAVGRRQQYVTSREIIHAKCQGPLAFTSSKNLKLKFIITKIPSFGANTTTDTYGSIQENGEKINIDFTNKNFEMVTEASEVSLNIPGDINDILLISIQALGCDDLDPPLYSWVKRQRDEMTLGCENTEHTWMLRCVGTKWVGSLGNCTHQSKVFTPTQAPRLETELIKPKKQNLAKEILFALIIGITVFLCAVVITIGYVCLKIAKYQSRMPTKNTIEMRSMLYEGEGTTSWRKVNKNNEPPSWQQTLPNGQVVQCNGTMSANGQKYYILDRDDMSTLQV